VYGDCKVSYELVIPKIDLVNDGEDYNKKVNNMCDLVCVIVVDDDLFSLDFKAFNFENKNIVFHFK